MNLYHYIWKENLLLRFPKHNICKYIYANIYIINLYIYLHTTASSTPLQIMTKWSWLIVCSHAKGNGENKFHCVFIRLLTGDCSPSNAMSLLPHLQRRMILSSSLGERLQNTGQSSVVPLGKKWKWGCRQGWVLCTFCVRCTFVHM